MHTGANGEHLNYFKCKTTSLLNGYSISNDDPGVQSLMEDFEKAQNMFSDVDTP